MPDNARVRSETFVFRDLLQRRGEALFASILADEFKYTLATVFTILHLGLPFGVVFEVPPKYDTTNKNRCSTCLILI